MACVALVVLLLCWLHTSDVPQIASTPVSAPPVKPTPSYFVATRSLSRLERVGTASGLIETVRSAPSLSIVVLTRPGHELYQLINDAELRTLLANRNPVILRQPDRPPQLLLDGRIFEHGVTLN